MAFELGNGFVARERHEWGARFDYGSRRLMDLPATESWMHHSVTAVHMDDPDRDARDIENICLGNFRIPCYSFLVHPAEVIHQVMDDRQGAHTVADRPGWSPTNRNPFSFGICFVGDYRGRVPTEWQLRAAAQIIIAKTSGIEAGKLLPGAPIRGHIDCKYTVCPSSGVYSRIPLIRGFVASGNDMPTAEEIAAAVWAHPLLHRSPGVEPPTRAAGYILGYVNLNAGVGASLIHPYPDQSTGHRLALIRDQVQSIIDRPPAEFTDEQIDAIADRVIARMAGPLARRAADEAAERLSHDPNPET